MCDGDSETSGPKADVREEYRDALHPPHPPDALPISYIHISVILIPDRDPRSRVRVLSVDPCGTTPKLRPTQGALALVGRGQVDGREEPNSPIHAMRTGRQSIETERRTNSDKGSDPPHPPPALLNKDDYLLCS